VHTDKKAATDKAKAMVASGVERVIENEPLDRMYVPIHPETLVVGGGIAGIQAALEIADSGKKSLPGGEGTIHRRAYGPVRQDLPHTGLFGLYSNAQDGGCGNKPQH
jgi:hypothetical protein